LRVLRTHGRTGANPSERPTLPFLPRDAGTEWGLASALRSARAAAPESAAPGERRS
jgi:hypothetical protein